jgi:hypothetical protein
MEKMRSKTIAVCMCIFIMLASCQNLSAAPVPSETSSPVATNTPISPTASVTPLPLSALPINPQPWSVVTPQKSIIRSQQDLENKIHSVFPACIDKNKAASPTGLGTQPLSFVEANIHPAMTGVKLSASADNVGYTRRAFVACKVDTCSNQLFVREKSSGRVYAIEWGTDVSSHPIYWLTWLDSDILIFFQLLDQTYGQIIAINYETRELLYSAFAYPKDNCPITPVVLPTRTPRVTPFPPYPLKQVLFNYATIGWHSSFDLYFTDYFWPQLVIYTDGQIIIPGRQTQQKMLSKDEIDYFFARLESLGFYSVETNQEHDPTDKLYNFGNDPFYEVDDGLSYCIFSKGDKLRDLCVREPYQEYLIPQMRSILEFLDYYRPGGMSLYYPDRLLVHIEVGRSIYLDDPAQEATLWPEHLSSLKTMGDNILYFQGNNAKDVFELFGRSGGMKVFVENGVEYTLYFDIVLPHQEVTNKYMQ